MALCPNCKQPIPRLTFLGVDRTRYFTCQSCGTASCRDRGPTTWQLFGYVLLFGWPLLFLIGPAWVLVAVVAVPALFLAHWVVVCRRPLVAVPPAPPWPWKAGKA